MREIKFRAWNKLAKKMAVIDMLDFMLDSYRAHAGKFSGSGRLADIELMQFTGLKDRDGKEIYEGDIVDFQTFDAKGIVTYVAPRFLASGHELQGYEVEVIGNIYGNPELRPE